MVIQRILCAPLWPRETCFVCVKLGRDSWSGEEEHALAWDVNLEREESKSHGPIVCPRPQHLVIDRSVSGEHE